MRFEGRCGGVFGNGGGAGGELVAVDEDVLVGGAAAFSGDDVGVVCESDFIYDADKTFGPARAVVLGFGVVVGGDERGGGGVFRESFVRGCGYGGGECDDGVATAVAGVCEAGFGVGDACEVEGHD